MVSTFTANVQIEEPARGDDVGTWDTPVNSNMTLIDLIVGGQTTISLNNAPVVLAAAQFQCRHITFNSTLTGNVTITFPTSFKKSYEIEHTCTGSSAFVITLQTTAAGGQVICAPPGETVECWNDGTNIKFKNLGRIGSYVDYATSSSPLWVTNCTVPPYLDCNGAAFSSATYPQLATVLNRTTVPDFRGFAPHYYNEGTGRLTVAGAGIDGNTLFSGGGNNGVTLAANQVPALSGTNTITLYPGANPAFNFVATDGNVINALLAGGASPSLTRSGGTQFVAPNTAANTQTITVNSGVQINIQNASPGLVSGIRMIRAA